MNDSPQKKSGEHAFLCETTVNGVHADLFVFSNIVLARFSSHPDDYEAAHLKSLTITSNVFLLVAFRLYLDWLYLDRLHAGQQPPGRMTPSGMEPSALQG